MTTKHQLQIPRKKVDSSNIEAIGFDKSKSILTIEFKARRGNKSRIYSYHPITESFYIELMNADSKGQFFAEKLRYNDKVTVKHLQ